jgi:hypothetical protein
MEEPIYVTSQDAITVSHLCAFVHNNHVKERSWQVSLPASGSPTGLRDAAGDQTTCNPEAEATMAAPFSVTSFHRAYRSADRSALRISFEV